MKKTLLYALVLSVIGIGAWLIFSESAPPSDQSAQEDTQPKETVTPKTIASPETSSSAPDSKSTRTPKEKSEDTKSKYEFADLMQKMEAKTATDEEEIAFWEAVKSSPEFSAMIKELEEAVEAGEDPVEDRLKLADLYVLKIITASSDPIKGIWGGKANKLWYETLEHDPVNWKAQHAVAFSLSQYPDFLNKTNDSIAAYEKLVNFPTGESNPEAHANAYHELSKLYIKKGRPADARNYLEKGLQLYPDHKNLKDAHDTVLGQYEFDDQE